MKLMGVYGASGFGREVMPAVRAAHPEVQCMFVDDDREGPVNGHDCVSYAHFLAMPNPEKAILIAIADAGIRRQLQEKCARDGLSLPNVFAPSAVVGDACDIGDGAMICSMSILTSNIRIGKGFHANLGSYVAHDCVIGDYVTFAPGVQCNGNITIGDDAYIGTGAILRQGSPSKPILIGAGAIVGMGAVVTRDVAPGVTVIGNPARSM